MATTERQRRIEEKTRVLSQVGKLAEGYRRSQAERQAIEARLKATAVPLMTHVSQTGQTFASRSAISAPRARPRRRRGSSPRASR